MVVKEVCLSEKGAKDQWQLMIELLPEFSDISNLTHLLREFFCNHNFSICSSNEICLVIEELTTNSVMHGYKDIPLGKRDDISIQISCDKGHKIKVLFKDSGIPFDPTLPHPPRKEDTIGGWGLTLIKKTLDSIKYKREGKFNVLTLSKKY